MLKLEELSNPNSCINRAKDDEMVFVLLARDSAAPRVIREWCAERVRAGKNCWADRQIVDAMNCALIMEQQRAAGIATSANAAPGVDVPGAAGDQK